jgi:hypothetical protein
MTDFLYLYPGAFFALILGAFTSINMAFLFDMNKSKRQHKEDFKEVGILFKSIIRDMQDELQTVTNRLDKLTEDLASQTKEVIQNTTLQEISPSPQGNETDSIETLFFPSAPYGGMGRERYAQYVRSTRSPKQEQQPSEGFVPTDIDDSALLDYCKDYLDLLGNLEPKASQEPDSPSFLGLINAKTGHFTDLRPPVPTNSSTASITTDLWAGDDSDEIDRFAAEVAKEDDEQSTASLPDLQDTGEEQGGVPQLLPRPVMPSSRAVKPVLRKN